MAELVRMVIIGLIYLPQDILRFTSGDEMTTAKTRGRRTVLSCIALASLAIAPTLRAAEYNVLDLGTLGGLNSFPGIAGTVNASGQVVGGANLLNSGDVTAFRTSANTPIQPADNLDTTGITTSGAQAVNDAGQAVGSFSYTGNSVQHAFRTAPNGQVDASTDLSTLGGATSAALGINATAQVVGYSDNADGASHAFRTDPGGVISAANDLGTLGGSASLAYSINTSGQATGSSYLDGDQTSHAFLTAANGVILPESDLGTLGGRNSGAHAVNDNGRVVGWSNTPGPQGLGNGHAFRTDPNSPITPQDDLGTLGGFGTFSQAWGINSAGQTVGWSTLVNEGTLRHAFLVDVDGTMHDLNNLIVPGSGMVLLAAYGINDAGQIAGYGLIDNNEHTFLLTPVTVPEPSVLLLLTLGGSVTLLRRQRSSRTPQ